MAQATKLFDLSGRGAPRPAASAATVSSPVTGGGPVGLPVSMLVESRAESRVFDGPRKLVRPRMPENAAGQALAPRRLRGAEPLVMHESHKPAQRATAKAASHAESLYFQKQMQAQTPMVFVLEDGENIQGVVEWFDRDTIKIRNASRMLIFKRSIKYLYKAGEEHA